MSFILDALRKAEHTNRNRAELSVPSSPQVLLDDTPTAPANWRRIIGLGLLALVFLAAGLMLGRMGSDTDSHTPGTLTSLPQQNPATDIIATSAQNTNMEKTAARNAATNVTPIRDTGTRSLDTEARKAQPAPAKDRSAPASPATSARAVEDTAARSQQPAVTPGRVTVAPGRVTVAPGRVTTETLPEYVATKDSGNVPLPLLHLDMHVYSGTPSKRFVFVNLKKYRQGDNIDDDTLIESIEPTGAVVNYKGYRFMLSPD